MKLADRAVSERETDHEEIETGGDASPNEPIRVQYAALPYRISATGMLDILLITSRDTGRWVIPKGWPMRGKTGAEVAAQEAFEEAGIVGEAESVAIGAYHYDKRLRRGSVICRVEVFSLDVAGELEHWPERRQRTRSWFSCEDAAALVEEEELKTLILAAQDQVLAAFDAKVAWPGV